METYTKETREFDWKLRNFTQTLSEQDQKNYFTEDFHILLDKRDTKWRLSISTVESTLGIFLLMEESSKDDFTVNFQVFVRKLNGKIGKSDQFTRISYEMIVGEEYGWSNFISIDDICNNADQYLEDNTLTLGIKITLVKKIVIWKIDTSKCRKHCPYLAMSKNYFETKAFSDFKIICSDKVEIPVHRLIVANFSPVFDALFRADMIESQNCVVEVNDIDGATMTEILRFIYTNKVQNLMELAPKILYGAEKYDLDKLKKFCVGSMIDNLCIGNAVEYFLLADKYNIQDLLERCIDFIRQNFKSVCKNKNWEQMEKKNLMMLLESYDKNPKHVRIFETTML